MEQSKTPDASGGGEHKRPWQPWERSYSGNRVGVRQDGEWTILHILSGGAETTTSIREHEAWDLAGRVSPKMLTTLQELGAENRSMRDALHELSAVCAAGNAEQLREAAEEIYCGDDCKHHFYDGSCNSHECSLDGTGECGWHRSESLKSLAEALETHAALASAPPAPTPEAGSDLAKLSAEDLRHEASFLLARLRDFEADLAEEQARGWYGHVEPSMSRLQAMCISPVVASPPPAEDLAGQGEPVAWQGCDPDEPYDPLKCAVWAALVPFQHELIQTGGVTFMGLRNAIVEAVRSFAIASQRDALAAPAPSRPADREEIARKWWDRVCPADWKGQWDTWKTADLKLARQLVQETYDDADAILALRDAPRDGGDGWRPIAELAPQTNAVLGRWARSGNTDDGKPYFYWQRATGRFFDHLGERHWCLEGSQTFATGPFYGEAPTHFYAIPKAPPSPNPTDGTQDTDQGGGR